MGLRGPKARGQEEWMVPVAELMIQEGMSFSAAAQALGIKFDNSAAERAAQYCEAFQNIVDALEFKYYGRTGNNPMLTKGYLAGAYVWALRRLREQDQPDKVATVGRELANLMGWNEEADDSKPVFANLTQTEINELRAKVEEQKRAAEAEKRAAEGKVQVVVVPSGDPN